MKIYLGLMVARQQDGEYVFVKVETASADKKKIESYFSDKPAMEAVVIQGVKCLAERSIIETDLE